MTSTTSPISFRVKILRLPEKGLPVTIRPDEETCAALARLHGLVAVKSFHAELMVSNWKRDGIEVRGRVRAEVVQTCVATLEPLDEKVDEQIEGLFVPQRSKLARFDLDGEGELVLDPDGPDLPEIFEGDSIDVGAFAEECFGVALEPYPRKPEVDTVIATVGEPEFGPMAEKLAALKKGS